MQWMVSINELGAQQARILDEVCSDSSRTHWIAGYAGTGKTVVITHAIERLAARKRSASICFLTYTHALKDLVRSGLTERTAGRVAIDTIDAFSASRDQYDYILVDEIQDVTESAIRKIFARAKHVIVAGDPDQSIYLGRVDPRGLQKLLDGARKHTLKHIQRLSSKTFRLATAILPEAEIKKGAEVRGEGNNGRLMEAKSRKEEFSRVYAEAVRVSSIQQPSAILFPTHDQIHEFATIIAEANGLPEPPKRERRGPITSYEAFNDHFSRRHIPLRFLGSNNGSLPESDTVRLVYLMTYHSAKGLDFNNVFLPDLVDGVNLDAKWAHLSSDERERRHFFVAITRSKENVYFSYHGKRHTALDRLPEDCLEAFIAPRKTFRRSA